MSKECLLAFFFLEKNYHEAFARADVQMKKTAEILKTVKDRKLYANVCRFKKPRSPVIITTTLAASRDFLDTYGKIISYFNKVTEMNSMLSNDTEDSMKIIDYLSTIK